MEDIKMMNYKKELLNKFVSNLSYVSYEDREALLKVSDSLLTEDIADLYKIYNALKEGENECTLHNFGFVKNMDRYWLIAGERKINLELKEIKEIISGFADILDEILPLGSVVELKKDYIRKITGNKELENAQVVIVNRFIFKNEVKAYFPYAGIVYPFGFVGNDHAIQFTSSLIDKVIHIGFQDDKDKAYTLAVKNELIVTKKMHSFGFATQEELKDYKKIMKGCSAK